MRKFWKTSRYTPLACTIVYIPTMCVFSLYLGVVVSKMIPVMFPIIRALLFAVTTLVSTYGGILLGACIIDTLDNNRVFRNI